MKDPGSAQFRNVAVVVNSLGEAAVCGEYNARNSFGGYVGFKTFGVVGEYMTTDEAEIERMGCLGADAERSRRELDARAALIDKLRAEAEFSCNVIWTLLDNHFRDRQSVEVALDAAMTATINRARENGHEISSEVLRMIRGQYNDVLTKTAAEKVAVKSIKRGDGIHRLQFTTSCVLSTTQALKAQAGIE